MTTLRALEQEFDALWLNTSNLPERLAEWQSNVALFLENLDPAMIDLESVEQCFDRWEKTLSENRALLEKHQQALKEEIKQGEPDPQKAAQSRQYQR